MTESLDFFSTKFDTLEKDCDKQNEKIRKPEENIKRLEERNKLLVESVADLELYSHQNCLLLHGVKERKCENTDEVTIKTLSEELNIGISHKDLDRTHVIGKTDRSYGK